MPEFPAQQKVAVSSLLPGCCWLTQSQLTQSLPSSPVISWWLCLGAACTICTGPRTLWSSVADKKCPKNQGEYLQPPKRWIIIVFGQKKPVSAVIKPDADAPFKAERLRYLKAPVAGSYRQKFVLLWSALKWELGCFVDVCEGNIEKKVTDGFPLISGGESTSSHSSSCPQSPPALLTVGAAASLHQGAHVSHGHFHRLGWSFCGRFECLQRAKTQHIDIRLWLQLCQNPWDSFTQTTSPVLLHQFCLLQTLLEWWINWSGYWYYFLWVSQFVLCMLKSSITIRHCATT